MIPDAPPSSFASLPAKSSYPSAPSPQRGASIVLALAWAGAVPLSAAEESVTLLPTVQTVAAEELGEGRFALEASLEVFRYRDGPRMELTGIREFRGGAVVEDGRIVLIPRLGRFIAEFDPATECFERTAEHGQPGGFGFGSVVDGDLVVMTPRGSRAVGLYDAATRSYRDGAAHGQASDNAFLGSARVRRDLVVFAPLNARVVGLYDPLTDTYRNGPAVPEEGRFLFSDIVLSSLTGEVVFTPFDSARVGIYDPETEGYRAGPPHLADTEGAYSGVAELEDGTLVMAPRNAERIGLYHPATGDFKAGPAHGEGSGAFMVARAWPGGEVVMAPYRSGSVGIYDPATGRYRRGPSVAHVDTLEHGQRFSGAVLTADGSRIILTNRGADRLGIIERSPHFDQGGEARLWFEYRETGEGREWRETRELTVVGPGTLRIEVADLPPGRQYEFRALADFGPDRAVGEVLRFRNGP